MAEIVSEFIVKGDLHTRVNKRMLDEDHRDNGISLDLQLRPPSGAPEGPVNVVPIHALNGGVVQHQPMLNLVNSGQRPTANVFLQLFAGNPTAPVDSRPAAVAVAVAAANGNAEVDRLSPPTAANVMVQHQPTLSLANGGQRRMVNSGLGLMGVEPPVNSPVVTTLVNLSPPPPPPRLANGNVEVAADARPRGRKRPNPQSDREKSPTITPPYPWSTDRRAKVYSINTLLNKGITFCSGEVQCRHCEQTSILKFPLVETFRTIWKYVCANRVEMHERAPQKWLQPSFPTCSNCGHENSLKPIIAEKKRNINWLFLLLGEMLGCCSLEQLKYFCKHTDNHRTGAKNRVLYLTYLTLCLQLNPDSPFKR